MMMTTLTRAPEAQLQVRGRGEPGPVLGDDQKRVLESRAGHLLVLGGPGAGKTTVLTEVVVDHLLGGRHGGAGVGAGLVPAEPGRGEGPGAAQHVGSHGHVRVGGAPERVAADPDRIAVLCLNRDAARGLSVRLSRRLGGGHLPQIGTFHSFALNLLRRHEDPDLPAPRLLHAADQEARLRELLTWAVQEGRLEWPDGLRPALGTRGIGQEVRRLLARARQLGLSGSDLSRLGRRHGNDAWRVLGPLLDEYLDVMAQQGAHDYVELLHSAAASVRHSRRSGSPVGNVELVLVDEYQEVDPGQVRLLRVLASAGARVVAFADPDQSTFGFRGADASNVAQFPEMFGDPGRAATVHVLTQSRRVPSEILDVARRVSPPTALAPLTAQVQREYRSLDPRPGQGSVHARVFPTLRAHDEGIVATIRRARAGLDGPSLEWSQMAVVVRAPRRTGRSLAAAMRQAGVPCAVGADRVALGQEPAVRQMLTAVSLAIGDPVTPAEIADLLGGVVGGLSALEVAALRAQVLAAHGGAGRVSDDSQGLAAAALREALAFGILPEGVDLRAGVERAFLGVARTVGAARECAEDQKPVADVLWAAWDAGGCARRLATLARSGGLPGDAADRALDAVIDLFEESRALPPAIAGPSGVRAFRAQVLGSALRTSRRSRERERNVVQILSPHAAKGREWELVVIAGLQDGIWPARATGGDLLGVAQVGLPSGPPPTHADGLQEERRLLAMACTRTRSRLIVAAVDDGDGMSPSRLLGDFGVVTTAAGPGSPVLIGGATLVAHLRQEAEQMVTRRSRGVIDPERDMLGEAAVRRLILLRQLLGPGSVADPATWWGSLSGTVGPPALPVSAPDDGGGEACEQIAGPAPAGGAGQGEGIAPDPEVRAAVAGVLAQRPATVPGGCPLQLSGSGVSSLLTCPRRWFLDRKVGAAPPSGPTATVGTMVHRLVEMVGRGELPPHRASLLAAALPLWSEVSFPADYQRRHEWSRLEVMVDAFLSWHRAGRSVLAVEVGFDVTTETAGGPVTLRGSIDRVDTDEAGNLYLVDFKTARTAISAQDAAVHPQMAVYQLAVQAGALQQHLGSGAHSRSPEGRARTEVVPVTAGELVFLSDPHVSGMPKVRHQAPVTGQQTWAHDLLDEAVDLARGDSHPARPGTHCRSCVHRVTCPTMARGAQPDGSEPEGAAL